MDFEVLKRDTLKFWKDYVVKADVTIDGVVHTLPIFSKDIDFKEDSIRINVYISAGAGEVQQVVIYNKTNEPIRVRESSLKKGEEGLLTVFLWKISIVEEFIR